MLDVERWAELRREHFVRGVSIKELARRTGLARNTIRAALRSEAPPAYERSRAPSKLDPFKEEIHDLLRGDPKLPGVRVRELIEPLGFYGGKTIVDDYLREVRPLFARTRTHQRTVYRPGEICQWDLWETSEHVPVGYGQTRRAWVVIACLGYSRMGAGALIFSKEAPDVLWGMGRCLWSLGSLAKLMVWDREGCLHAGRGRPTDAYAGFCGQLLLDWYFCEAKDPQAKGVVERLQGYLETNFEPGRRSSLTNSIFSCSSTRGLRRPTRGRTGRSKPVRSTGSRRSVGRCGHYRRSRLMSTDIGCCGWRPRPVFAPRH